MTMRRSVSTPTLSGASGADDGLEIFVATRALQCKLQCVPERLQNTVLRDVGCAHYYTVIRHANGSLTSLDFGPIGGRDIAFRPARESLWQWGRNRLAGAPPAPRGTPGEVREMLLMEMPASSMFVGRTKLSMRDIRSFNSLQNNLYLLHKSDCRHYVNNLVQYATGVEGITRKATREIYMAQRTTLAWVDRLVLLTHNLTDVGQWPRVQRAAQTAMTVLAALGGRRCAARLAVRLQGSAALAGLPWRAATAQQAQRAAVIATGGSSTALTRAATAGLPLPRMAGAATAAGAATLAAVHPPEVSFLTSLGEGLKSTGSMLRAASARAGSAAAAAAAVGGMRLKAPVQRPSRPARVTVPPTKRRSLRQTGLLVMSAS